MLEYMYGARHLYQRKEQPSVGICARGKAFVSKRRTAECWNTCMGQGICFKETNSRVLEYMQGARHFFKEKNSRVLEHMHGAKHLFQREEQPSVGIRAWGKAFVSKRRIAECCNTCMRQGICFKEKNSRVLEYVHGERDLFQREEQTSVGICAWDKAFFFKEKNSRVLEHMHGARHLFQREEQPSVRISAWGKVFVSKRGTAECWNTCMGQGICFKEKNIRVLEYVHGAWHLFQREEESSVEIRAWGNAFVS